MKLSEEIQEWIIDEETAYFPGTETMRGWADKAIIAEAVARAAGGLVVIIGCLGGGPESIQADLEATRDALKEYHAKMGVEENDEWMTILP